MKKLVKNICALLAALAVVAFGTVAVRADISSKDDMRAGAEQEYEYKINRMTNENISLRDELNSLQTQLQRYES